MRAYGGHGSRRWRDGLRRDRELGVHLLPAGDVGGIRRRPAVVVHVAAVEFGEQRPRPGAEVHGVGLQGGIVQAGVPRQNGLVHSRVRVARDQDPAFRQFLDGHTVTQDVPGQVQVPVLQEQVRERRDVRPHELRHRDPALLRVHLVLEEELHRPALEHREGLDPDIRQQRPHEDLTRHSSARSGTCPSGTGANRSYFSRSCLRIGRNSARRSSSRSEKSLALRSAIQALASAGTKCGLVQPHVDDRLRVALGPIGPDDPQHADVRLGALQHQFGLRVVGHDAVPHAVVRPAVALGHPTAHEGRERDRLPNRLTTHMPSTRAFVRLSNVDMS